MKQSKLTNAYKIITRLSTELLPLPISWGIYKLRNEIEPQWKFQLEQEQAFADSLGATINENGLIIFKDDETREEYLKKFNELGDMEVDIKIEPLVIDASKINVKISGNEIEALSGIINFE